MTLLGLLVRLLLRAFGVIAVESEPPTGPPARVTYPSAAETGVHHVGWPDHGHSETGRRDYEADRVDGSW